MPSIIINKILGFYQKIKLLWFEEKRIAHFKSNFKMENIIVLISYPLLFSIIYQFIRSILYFYLNHTFNRIEVMKSHMNFNSFYQKNY